MIYTLLGKSDPQTVDFVISFDSVSSMSEDMKASVSNQTVEEGFDITDHINVDPTEFSIDAVVSSYSLFNTDNEIVWDGEGFVGNENFEPNSHSYARDKIISVFKSKSILTLLESSNNSKHSIPSAQEEELKQGYFKEHPNVVITSLSISSPDSGSGAFYISLKLQEVIIASVLQTELTEEQMTPAVRPLMEKEKSVSSKADKTSEEDGLGNVTEGGEDSDGDSDFEVETAPNFKKGGRLTQAEGAKKAAEERAAAIDRNQLVEEALKRNGIDGGVRQIKPVNDYWQMRTIE